jgi:replicative DNA helicase
MDFDVFISHASEDKQTVARPLADLLKALGVKVWIDESELTLGDSLRRKIDNGLIKSRFGVVILSKSFFAKEWPQKELDGLVAREDGKEKVILPIWHNITINDVRKYSPPLADRLAAVTSRGLGSIADQIFSAVEADKQSQNISASIKAQAATLTEGNNKPGDTEETHSIREGAFHAFDSLIADALDRIVAIADGKSPEITGVRTGIVDLDSITLGLQPGQVVVVASRPRMGKTSLMANLAGSISVNEGLPVIVISLDLNAHEFTNRVLSASADLCTRDMSTGSLSEDGWISLSESIEALRSANIFIRDTLDKSSGELINNINCITEQFGGAAGLIIIDGLQQVIGRSDIQAKESIDLFLRKLKTVAKQAHCPVILTSPLNRTVETRTDKRPQLSDLAEIGDIEQHSDCVLFLYRDAFYNAETQRPDAVEIIVAKQKRGPVGTVISGFNSRSGAFNQT